MSAHPRVRKASWTSSRASQADPQAAGPLQVGERAFYDPASGAESGALFGARARDDRLL
jgi:hypothetical protein